MLETAMTLSLVAGLTAVSLITMTLILIGIGKIKV